jgi:hypothetical protein
MIQKLTTFQALKEARIEHEYAKKTHTSSKAEEAAAPQTTEAVRKGAETKTEIRANHGKANRESERIRKQRAYRS